MSEQNATTETATGTATKVRGRKSILSDVPKLFSTEAEAIAALEDAKAKAVAEGGSRKDWQVREVTIQPIPTARTAFVLGSGIVNALYAVYPTFGITVRVIGNVSPAKRTQRSVEDILKDPNTIASLSEEAKAVLRQLLG